MGNFWKKALPYAAGALGSGVMSAFGMPQFAAAGAAAGGALANSKNRWAGAAQGVAGGGVGSALWGGVTGKSGFGAGAMQGLKNYGSSIPGFKGIGTANPTGVMAKFLTPQSIQGGGMPGKANSLYTPIGNGPASSGGKIVGYNPTQLGMQKMAAQAAPSISTPASSGMTKGIGDLFSKFTGGGAGGDGGGLMGQMLPGLGMTMAGNMMAPKVSTPDFAGATAPLRESLASPGANSAMSADFYKTVIG